MGANIMKSSLSQLKHDKGPQRRRLDPSFHRPRASRWGRWDTAHLLLLLALLLLLLLAPSFYCQRNEGGSILLPLHFGGLHRADAHLRQCPAVVFLYARMSLFTCSVMTFIIPPFHLNVMEMYKRVLHCYTYTLFFCVFVCLFVFAATVQNTKLVLGPHST